MLRGPCDDSAPDSNIKSKAEDTASLCAVYVSVKSCSQNIYVWAELFLLAAHLRTPQWTILVLSNIDMSEKKKNDVFACYRA